MGQKRQRIKAQTKKFGNPKYYAACWGKMRLNREQAKEAKLVPTAEVYKCRYCEYWHVGRKPWRNNKK